MSKDFTNKITDLLIVGVLCTALLGTIVGGFNTMAADSTNFSAVQMIILGVIGIFIVLGIALHVLRQAGVSKR